LSIQSVKNSIIGVVVQRPALKRAVIGVGRGLSLLCRNYTPGLSTEAHLLARHVKVGEAVEVRDGGFYVGDEMRVASAYLSAKLLNNNVSTLLFDGANAELLEPHALAQRLRSTLRPQSLIDRIMLPLEIYCSSFMTTRLAKLIIPAHPDGDHYCENGLTKPIIWGSSLLLLSLMYYINLKRATIVDKIALGLFTAGVSSNLIDLISDGHGTNHFEFGNSILNFADVFTAFGLLFFSCGKSIENYLEGNLYRAFLFSCSFAGVSGRIFLDFFI
jgi:hypothetical protein